MVEATVLFLYALLCVFVIMPVLQPMLMAYDPVLGVWVVRIVTFLVLLMIGSFLWLVCGMIITNGGNDRPKKK